MKPIKVRKWFVASVFCLGGMLALMPFSGNAQLTSKYPRYPPISGKIPASILKKITAIHPGTTRAEFSKQFRYYAPGITETDIGYKAGPSPHIFRYEYRFACVPLPEDGRRTYSHELLLLKQHSDQVHWRFLKNEDYLIGGIWIMVDITWNFARRARGNDIHENDVTGNPDDVITHVSKPYLIYDSKNSG